MSSGRRQAWLGLTAGAVAFVLLATANSAGYRYGVSDQAFYLPATLLRQDPSLFPHDRPILLAQDRTSPVVTFMVVYHVGSRNEAPGNTIKNSSPPRRDASLSPPATWRSRQRARGSA